MGACLSCLGLSSHSSSDETSPLLSHHTETDADDPYSPSNPNFRASHHLLAAASADEYTSTAPRDPEALRRERAAKDHIQRWASDQIVDVFPNMNVLTPAPAPASGSTNVSVAGFHDLDFTGRSPRDVGGSRSKSSDYDYDYGGVGSGHERGNEGVDPDAQADGNAAGVKMSADGDGGVGGGMAVSTHQDFLLSTIPGDRSKRSIRIYPPSRGNTSVRASRDLGAGASETGSMKSTTSGSRSATAMATASDTRANRQRKGEGRAVVKLNIDLP